MGLSLQLTACVQEKSEEHQEEEAETPKHDQCAQPEPVVNTVSWRCACAKPYCAYRRG